MLDFKFEAYNNIHSIRTMQNHTCSDQKCKISSTCNFIHCAAVLLPFGTSKIMDATLTLIQAYGIAGTRRDSHCHAMTARSTVAPGAAPDNIEDLLHFPLRVLEDLQAAERLQWMPSGSMSMLQQSLREGFLASSSYSGIGARKVNVP